MNLQAVSYVQQLVVVQIQVVACHIIIASVADWAAAWAAS